MGRHEKTLQRGGLLLLIGYPRGPKEIEQLYTRALLESAFGEFRDVSIGEEELGTKAPRMRGCPPSSV